MHVAVPLCYAMCWGVVIACAVSFHTMCCACTNAPAVLGLLDTAAKYDCHEQPSRWQKGQCRQGDAFIIYKTNVSLALTQDKLVVTPSFVYNLE